MQLEYPVLERQDTAGDGVVAEPILSGRRLRVGISTSVIQRGKTGIAQHLFALLRALDVHRRDHDFVLFVLEEDVPLLGFLQGMRTVVVPEKFRPALRNIAWHQSVLPALARELHLDALHVPSYRRLVWRHPCALVGTIHDLAPFHVNRKYDWKRMFYGRVVARQLALRQDRIIAISENTARDVRRFFRVPPEKIEVIYNGIEHERFFPGPKGAAQAMVRERYGLEKPFALYVARIEHPAKNHLRLVQAFERFKASTRSDWQLVLAGSDWHGAETIHNAVRASKYASDIRCLGFVGDSDLPDFYRAAEVFVYPSLYEGFGLPPAEAMACRCPVISSDRGSLGEVVGKAAAIVDPEAVDSIAAELQRVAIEPTRRGSMVEAGLLQAQRFNWKTAAAKTVDVYRKAVAKRETRH